MQFDLNFLIWIQQNLRSALLDGAMVFVSTIGNAGMVWLAASVALICTRRYRKYGLVLVGALALGYLAGDVLIKNLVCRPRPFTEVGGLELLIPPPDSFSFPSGHTLSSFAAATVLFAANRRFGAAAYLLAAPPAQSVSAPLPRAGMLSSPAKSGMIFTKLPETTFRNP